jgi:hypothetical protein
MSTTDTASLRDYAPVPRSALGPDLNEQGYYVGRVERNLNWPGEATRARPHPTNRSTC